MKIIFGMAGLNAAELHGNMSQLQRLDALEQFRDAKVNFLLATDLASRGLDIIGMKTVINFTLPNTESIYIHRVGRTARAGKNGLAVSLVGDSAHDRKILKSIVKHAYPGTCKHRLVSMEAVDIWKKKIQKMEGAIEEVLQLEIEEKAVRMAEMEAEKATNMIIHKDEILSRPKRTWFMSEHQKQKVRDQAKQAVQQSIVVEVEEKTPEEEKKIENKIDPKVYVPARIPSVPNPMSRKEKKKKNLIKVYLIRNTNLQRKKI